MHLVDHQRGLQFSYTAELGKVFQWNADAGGEAYGRQFVHALLNDQDLKDSFPNHEVSKVDKSNILLDGERMTQYLFHVHVVDQDDIQWETTILADSRSGRIVRWEDRYANGMLVTVVFDYLEDGQQDVFALGAPADAEVVNIATPNSELFGN